LKGNEMGIEEDIITGSRRGRYPGTEEKVERNLEIWQALQRGEGVGRLSRRFRISPTRVKQIRDQMERRYR
jgi:hypothetical protein